MTHTKCLLAATLLLGLFIQSCKKSNGNAPAPGSLTASVGGSAWAANFVSPKYGVTVAAEVNDTIGVVAVVGVRVAGPGDTSIVSITFDESVTLNTPVDLSGDYSVIYVTETDAYSSEPSLGGTGTLTVTKLDLAGKVVAGTFSGTLRDTNGNPITVTGGEFQATIVP